MKRLARPRRATDGAKIEASLSGAGRCAPSGQPHHRPRGAPTEGMSKTRADKARIAEIYAGKPSK
jgi:hypothetical protein